MRCAHCGAYTCQKGLLIAGSEHPLGARPLYICWRHALLDSERVKAEQAQQDDVPRPLIREKRLRHDSPHAASHGDDV